MPFCRILTSCYTLTIPEISLKRIYCHVKRHTTDNFTSLFNKSFTYLFLMNILNFVFTSHEIDIFLSYYLRWNAYVCDLKLNLNCLHKRFFLFKSIKKLNRNVENNQNYFSYRRSTYFSEHYQTKKHILLYIQAIYLFSNFWFFLFVLSNIFKFTIFLNSLFIFPR